MRLLLALTTALLLGACSDTTCKIKADCASNEVCVVGQNICRKSCTLPIDCGGSQTCSHLPDGSYACLNPNEILKLPQSESTDQSLGAYCQSDGNGVDTTGTCGDVSSLCTQVFGPNESSAVSDYTCTKDCQVDSDCSALAVSSCTGDCLAAYQNACCIPALPIASTEQYTGAKKDSKTGAALSLFCRPRADCYFIPKRCGKDTDCGGPGSRAGSVCTTTADGGGSCVGGHLGAYECCQRDGECDQDTAHGGTNGLSCTQSLDGLSGYCSKPCKADADCQAPNVPNASANASCWTTTFDNSTTPDGQCRVVLNPHPICRNQPKPSIPNPATALVKCDFVDRPQALTDNKYNATTRRCDRTF